MQISTTAALAIALTTIAAPAWAHAPTFDEGAYASPEDPYFVDDPSVSIVLYRNVTCEQPELWMELDGQAGFPLFVQLLIPQIDRLADYRPSLAVVGPGLPAADVGIDLPEGMGARVFDTQSIADPEPFYEPFTRTNDYILVEDTIPLPESTTYYVVAWDPDGRTGKLAVAIGTVESFGLDALALLPEWTEKTRTFHETPDYPPSEPIEESICGAREATSNEGATMSTADGGVAHADADPPVTGNPSGCSVGAAAPRSSASGLLAALTGAVAWALRRRRSLGR